MSVPNIYADFQNLDDNNRIRLTCAGTVADLSRHGIELADGMALLLYTDDADDEGRSDNLLADGVVRRDEQAGCWVAEVDWSALRHESDAGGVETNGAVHAVASEDGVTGLR